jgi:hypothetical protein
VEVCPWNLVQNSENFSAIWTAQNATITTNSLVAPNGTTTADSLIAANAVNTYSGVYVTDNTDVVKTISCYVKKGSKRWVFLLGYSGNSNCWFDLDNGVVGTRGSSFSASSITSVGNGWFRIDAVMNLTTGGSNNIGVYAADADNSNTCTGDGTTVSSYIWGYQCNIGSTAKPYFPTTDRLNVPRLTYQNGGGGCPSLLLEKQSTNLITYSEQFDDGSWSKTGSATITSNNQISPDGTQNADTLNAGAINAQVQGTFIGTSGSVYTVSMYIKRITGTGNVFFRAVENVNTLISVTNQWQRFTATVTSTTTTIRIGVRLATSGDAVAIWGGQVEQSSYPTSYIPTTSASATRVADLGSNDVFGSTYTLDADFCLFQDFECFDFGNFPVFWSGGNYVTSADYRSYMIAYSTTSIILFGVGEATTAELTAVTFAPNTRYKLAVRRVGSTINWFVNGVKYSNTSGTPTTTVKIRSISGASLGGQNVMKLNEAIIFEDQTLTDADCISLTTI